MIEIKASHNSTKLFLESSFICILLMLMFLNAVKMQKNIVQSSKVQLKFSFPDNCDSKPADDVIECHRAIIASRCPWFRRALLAGMKESRER